MANVDYTATGLVTSAQRRGLLPNTQETLSLQDYYAFMSEDVYTYIVPLVMAAREEYWVTTTTFAYTTATDTYAIPSRAIGTKLRQIQIQNGAGAAAFVPLPRCEPERAYNYATSGMVDAYDLQGNNIVLVPFPTGGGNIQLRWFLRPNQVVDASAAAQITSINTGTNTVTCSGGLPGTFTSGITYDLIKGTPGFDNYAFDQVGTVSGNTVQFTALPSALAVGDWVALAGQTPVPQIPYDLYPLLSQKVACSALEAIGDKAGLAVAESRLEKMELKIMSLLQPRTEGSGRVVMNQYGPGFARIGRFRRR